MSKFISFHHSVTRKNSTQVLTRISRFFLYFFFPCALVYSCQKVRNLNWTQPHRTSLPNHTVHTQAYLIRMDTLLLTHKPSASYEQWCAVNMSILLVMTCAYIEHLPVILQKRASNKQKWSKRLKKKKATFEGGDQVNFCITKGLSVHGHGIWNVGNGQGRKEERRKSIGGGIEYQLVRRERQKVVRLSQKLRNHSPHPSLTHLTQFHLDSFYFCIWEFWGKSKCL